MLWDILHNRSAKHIDDPNRELVRLLEQAEHGRWVLPSRVNKNRIRTNLVVIVEATSYCNIKNTYRPCKDLESFENGNDEISSNGLEEEYADPSNNDARDSHHNEEINSVSKSDNKQVDSRLTEEIFDGSATNEDGTHATAGSAANNRKKGVGEILKPASTGDNDPAYTP